MRITNLGSLFERHPKIMDILSKIFKGFELRSYLYEHLRLSVIIDGFIFETITRLEELVKDIQKVINEMYRQIKSMYLRFQPNEKIEIAIRRMEKWIITTS